MLTVILRMGLTFALTVFIISFFAIRAYRQVKGIKKIEKVNGWRTTHPFVFFAFSNLAPVIIILILCNLISFMGAFTFSIIYLMALILGQASCYFLFKKPDSHL